jgi:hypothetical protein
MQTLVRSLPANNIISSGYKYSPRSHRFRRHIYPRTQTTAAIMVKDQKFYDILGVSGVQRLGADSMLTAVGSARRYRGATQVGIQEGCAEMASR